MKILAAATAVGAILVGGAVVGAAPAHAESTSISANSCVDRSEYRKAHRGMDKSKVARIFDTNGKQSTSFTIGDDRYETRDYKTCTSRYGFVSLSYKNGNLTDKFVYWG